MWLLRHFGAGARSDEAILGDLMECYQRGRSKRWLWKQTAFVIIGSLGGNVRKASAVVMTLVVGFLIFLLQAQAQFTIRAASDQPVAGWKRMEYNNHAVWVNPTPTLTSADVLRAERSKTQNGAGAVGIIFTDAGAKKMADLSHAQLDKLIAMVLDGKVIFAPKVRAEIGKQALITGKGSEGLPAKVAQQIVQSVNRK